MIVKHIGRIVYEYFELRGPSRRELNWKRKVPLGRETNFVRLKCSFDSAMLLDSTNQYEPNL